MQGVYQHCGEKHLHRYLAEFDFRYSNRIALGVNDAARTTKALKGIEGKRLTYRRIGIRGERLSPVTRAASGGQYSAGSSKMKRKKRLGK